MEDLVPLIFFLVIVIANGLKFLVERKLGKQPPPEPQPGRRPQPKQQPTTIEEFFEQLSEKVAPSEAHELPDWPETLDRPDYVGEMEAFEQARARELEEEAAAMVPEHPPAPSPEPPPKKPPIKVPGMVARPTALKSALSKSPLQAMKAMPTVSQCMRLPDISPFGRTGAAGQVQFDIKNRKALRHAMRAHLVFSPPRACDQSFDNTVAK
jgi:hypothetical protein